MLVQKVAQFPETQEEMEVIMVEVKEEMDVVRNLVVAAVAAVPHI